jgi:hypothetical protein
VLSLVHTVYYSSSQSAVSSPVVAWLLCSNNDYSWRPNGSITALANRRMKTTVMAFDPRYITSTRTAQKTTLPTVTLLLRVTQPLPSNDCFSGSTILALSKYTTMWFTFRFCVVQIVAKPTQFRDLTYFALRCTFRTSVHNVTCLFVIQWNNAYKTLNIIWITYLTSFTT